MILLPKYLKQYLPIDHSIYYWLIVDQASAPIGPEDTAHDVFLKLIPLAGTVLRRSLPAILAGRAEGVEQDESRATIFGRRRQIGRAHV